MPTEHKHTVAGETAAVDSAESGLDESAAFEEILLSLKRRGFGACAECLAELWFADDIDEDGESLSLESVRGFVKLMDAFQDLGEPMLGRFLAGTLSVEWRATGGKRIFVEPLDGDCASFALICPSPTADADEFRLNGRGKIADVVAALRNN